MDRILRVSTTSGINSGWQTMRFSLHPLCVTVTPVRWNVRKIKQFEEMLLTIDFDSSEVPSTNKALAIKFISPRDIGTFS